MILLAFLLVSVGLADLVRARSGSARLVWTAAAVGTATFVLGSTLSGQDWWWSPIALLLIAAWLLATRETPSEPGGQARREAGRLGRREGRREPGRDHRAGYWALGGFAVLVVVAVAWGRHLPAAGGALVDWYSALPYATLKSIDFTTAVLAVGSTLFLVETANVIVRLALRGEKFVEITPVPTPAPAAPRRFFSRHTEPPTIASAVSFTELKGGRFIGPLERIFLLALILSGDFAAIAAIVAAKGIIRFPEISKDAAGGSKAEYFLVGSFASWALVVIAVVIINFGPTISG